MDAVLTKPLKNNVKIVKGKILQNGMGFITLLVSKGTQDNIKRFKKEHWNISYYESI